MAPIEISDGEDTASSAGEHGGAAVDAAKSAVVSLTTKAAAASALGKRKLTESEVVALEEKVEWTDDSEGDYAHLRGTEKKRRRTAKGKGADKGKGSTPAAKDAKGKAISRKSRGKSTRTGEVAESSGPDADDLVDARIPEYYRRRRAEFNKAHETLREAGLKLPPDYSEIYFSDDERPSGRRLAERPRFEESTGVKPCREYKEIELEYSAGLIPASIAQYLRDYQIAGVKFLHQLFVYQKGGILGDDMGLGKTVQVAAFLTAAFGKTGDMRDDKRMRKMRRRERLWYPRILIVCPGSLIENWKIELNRWGWWHVELYHGSDKDFTLQAAKAGRMEIMITTYVTYKNNKDFINTVQWDAVVADECHLLKERTSETTRAMDEVNALCRIGLTGTAIQNKYEELWTLLNWTNPGRFGSHSEWNQSISRPLTVGQSHDATLHQLSVARTTAKKLVQNLLPEFFLRRMKTLIAHQLPKKSDKVVFCPLTEVQRDAYENFLASDAVEIIKRSSEPCDCNSGRKRGWCCHASLPNGRSWQSLVFPSIMTMQKIANHVTLLIPSSVDASEKQKSELNTLQTCLPEDWAELYKNRESLLTLSNPEFCGKWKILKKLLRFWHENGDKALVFSHSVRLLRILQHLFRNTSYNVSYLDGSLSYEDRQKAVDNFNSDPSQFVFLISTKAGGVGLNITSANKVVIFDPHWNPSYDLQAQDRAYRIGQVRDVDVFRLISAGTIEEIVYARQIYKQQQANIGYNASNERRYFKGVQQDSDRRGEIFGLNNLLTYHPDQVVLRDIVNKTNIAEAKAGVHLTDIDMDKVVKDEDSGLGLVKQEDTGDEDGGMGQLAKLLTAEDQEDYINANKAKGKSDAIAAILASAGVEYTHENSEVVGSSKIEEQLSRRAEMAAGGNQDGDGEGDSALFADSQANAVPRPDGAGGAPEIRYRYNPPADVMKRQFCSMALEFGFNSATEFALVVEGWTQEQRRNCLNTFYKRRAARLVKLEAIKKDEYEEEDEKFVVKDEVGELNTSDHHGNWKQEEKTEEQVKPNVGDEVKPMVKTQDRRALSLLSSLEKENKVKSEDAKIKVEDKKTSVIFLYDSDDEDDEL